MNDKPAITIDSDVPLPPRSRTRFPFRGMKIGDSFFVPLANQHSVGHAAIQWAKGQSGEKIKFATRKVDGGVRVWRVS